MTVDGALARVIRSAAGRGAAARAEACELCAAPVPGEHPHLYDTADAEVRCVCGPCSVLFADDAAGEGRYRLVPRRRLRLPPVDTAVLGVPVGLVFFVPRSDGTVTAQGPSPAGAMRWEVDAAAWQRLSAVFPQLASMAPDVEALLVNTVRGLQEHWIVPVDDCFRMVAVIRREWRGLSGGERVWPAVERFFAELTERS
ncbi:DUF5947 family protein [Streptomyces collinus]|uniref:Uncharacterized protein n=1 Tax=Streptomyces collinus (strain DSM 40733 / Tue 365) TaxID=1214242 RepID=S5UWZ5_STRC3|nr:DUF5947 family protein [Streptomyces collinus]AGS67559.1 hypothetical protein B446_03635 [Streptomyces collinus Tu 365]UJA06239.1 hypothetical protein HGI10_01180 [Streptomyces collinus]UJA12591.1 hypothetical protein HGI10_65760 [Streptomyces collinus]